MVPVMPADFEGMLPPPHLGVTVRFMLTLFIDHLILTSISLSRPVNSILF